jgi:uncharacterized repeat protein (TIGR01451 family)
VRHRNGFLEGKRTAVAIASLVAMAILASLISPASFISPAFAGPNDITLVWNVNSEPDVAGYRIAWGSSPGSHPNLIDAGNVTTYTVTGLTQGSTYYFVVQAYDGAGNLSPNSQETSAVAGAAPALSLSLQDNPDPVQAGANLTYTLSYANSGAGGATSVVVTDTIPANTTFVSATGGGTRSGSVVTWNLGTLAAGASGSVQMVVQVVSPLASGTVLTNSGAAIDSAETNLVTASSLTTTVASAPLLAIAATDSPDPVAAGGNITYTLSYSNTGNMNATGLVLSDTLPANTTYVSSTGSGTLSSGTVTWSVASLNAGASGSVQMVVKTASPLANGTLITHGTYSIDSAQTSPVSGASITTTVTSTPTMTLALTDAPDPVQAGGNITYTLTYGNNGSMDASGVVVTDVVPANTTFVSATAGGTLASGTVSWNLGSVAVGATGSVQMTVQVANPLTNGTVIANNGASIDSTQTNPVNAASVNTTVTSAPVLSVSAADSPDPVQAGANLTYTLSYGNSGNATGTSVVISDTLPANTTFVSATGGGTLASGVVTWSIGTLASGGSGSVQLVVKVVSPLANGTTITNATYSIDSAQTTPVAGAALTTAVSSAPVLALTLTDSPDPVAAGANITYTLSYSNTGNMNATGLVLSDTLPANTTYVSSTGSGALSSGTVTWSVASLNAGASGSVQLVAKVASPLASGTTITNDTSSIDSAQTTPVGGAPVTTGVTSAPAPTLSVTDAPDPVPAGGNITYTLTYGNNGTMDATGVVISDTVPANTTFVSATAGGALSSSTVTWTLGNLAVGATGSVQMTVQVANPLANGTVINHSGASIDTAQTNPVNAAAVTTTVTSAPILSLSASDSPDPVQAGANLTYTLSYGNSGNATGTSVVLSDTLPANTTFVSATGGGTLASGVVTWSIGTLASAGSGSVQLVVKVASPLANGATITNATYSIDSAQTNPVSGAAVTTGVSSAPVLALTLTGAPDPVNAGSNLTYTLAYGNSGNANATGTVITMPLPANTTYVSSSPVATVASGTATWSLGTVNAGVSTTVTLIVKVTSPLANGTLITASGAAIDSNETAPVNAASTTTTVGSAPAPTLSVTDAPDPVPAGGNITYTLTYGNNGTMDATGVVISDTVPANTTFVSATAGGALSSSTVTWTLGNLAVGATGSVQMTVQVANPLANGTVINHSGASIDTAQTNPVNAAAVTTTVTSAPILSLSASDSPDPVQAGANLTYTLSYGNSGNATGTSVVLSDTLPANTTFVSATGGGTLASGVVTWSIGTLASAGSGSVQLVVKVASPLANGATITNATYSIDSAQTNPVSGAAVTTGVSSAPVLALTLTGAPDPVNAGSNLTYTLAYGNSGNANATGTVITMPLPANTTYVSSSPVATVASGTATWSLGTVNAGVSTTVTLIVKVTSPLANGTLITASGAAIDSNETSPVSAASIATTVATAPALTLSMSDSPDPVQAGSNLTYTLAYGNNGNANASGVVLTTAVPANTSFVSATGGGILSSGTVTWNLGTINTGTNASVQVVVHVASPLANGTTIASGAPAIVCNETSPVNGAATTTTVQSAPSLSVALSDSPDPVAAGATLTYTLSYANNGNASATGVVLTTAVPASTSFVSATGGGTFSAGTITWNLGTLNTGASGSVQAVVQVASPLTNGTVIASGATSIDSNETTPKSATAIGTTVTSTPILTLLGSDSPDPVGAGQQLTYTLTYANSGNAAALNTLLHATLPANTTFVSASNGGLVSSGIVTWSLGTLGTNAFGSVTLGVRVATPLANGTTLTLQTITIESTQTAPAAGAPVTTTVTSNPLLSLTVSDAPDPVLAGTNLTYTIAFSNTGNSPATQCVLSAPVPSGTTFVSATGGGALQGSTVTWDLGTLNAGVPGSVQMTVAVPQSATSGSVITASGIAIDSNETGSVGAAVAYTSITDPSAPTVTAAVELVTDSTYLVRGAQQLVQVTGSAFLDGAVLNLSPDISAGPTTVKGTTSLTDVLTVANGATLGPRTVSVTNPNGHMGSLADALRVVKKSDINTDCKADGIDLNALARSWNDAVGDPGYNPAVDYDGDGYVGPDDLTAFVVQFGKQQPGCP